MFTGKQSEIFHETNSDHSNLRNEKCMQYENVHRKTE